MGNFLPLMLFTFISQAAAGMILIKGILTAAGRLKYGDRLNAGMQYLISMLLTLALLIAFFHLGKPLRAVYALRNITRSPLSMEVASLALLIFLTYTDAWLLRRRDYKTLRPALNVLSPLLAVLFLASMSAIYLLPSVPAWYSPATPLCFTLTALSAGAALTAFMTWKEHWQTSYYLLLTSVLTAAVIVIVNIIKLSRQPGTGVLLTILNSVLIVSALLFIPGIKGSGEMNKKYRITVISGIIVLLSGLTARLLFFLSYDNNIL